MDDDTIGAAMIRMIMEMTMMMLLEARENKMRDWVGPLLSIFWAIIELKLPPMRITQPYIVASHDSLTTTRHLQIRSQNLSYEESQR